jgi:hypothetical protein
VVQAILSAKVLQFLQGELRQVPLWLVFRHLWDRFRFNLLDGFYSFGFCGRSGSRFQVQDTLAAQHRQLPRILPHWVFQRKPVPIVELFPVEEHTVTNHRVLRVTGEMRYCEG